MDISAHYSPLSPARTALVSFCVLCAALALAGWQILTQHQHSVIDHLRLNTLTVLERVEGALQNGLYAQDGVIAFHDDCLAYFATLEAHNDLRFAGLFDPNAGAMLLAHGPQLPEGVALPTEALLALQENREWSGSADCGGNFELFAAARPLALESPAVSAVLVVGLDMTAHNAIDRAFRLRVFMVLGAVLLAGAVTWAAMLLVVRRNRRAHKLAALENFQAELLDRLPEGLITIGPDDVIRAVNPAALSILKVQAEELVGRNVRDVPSALARWLPCAREAYGIWAQRRLGEAQLEVLTLPIPLHDREEDPAPQRLVVIRDRTLLKKLEAELADAERLAAAGTLAAGLAHEIRNPLSSLRGLAQFFEKHFAENPANAARAAAMVREVDRINRVLSDLLYLAKPQRITLSDVQIKPALQDIYNLLSIDLSENGITFSMDLQAPCAPAQADGLNRALLNLILNSIEALKEVPVAEKSIRVSSWADKAGVWIEVRDNGAGMDADESRRAFEPFFSTKAGGTGLGLQLVKKIMHDHGGTAQIASSLHAGTGVSLFFPGQCGLPPESELPEDEWSPAPPKGTE